MKNKFLVKKKSLEYFEMPQKVQVKESKQDENDNNIDKPILLDMPLTGLSR